MDNEPLFLISESLDSLQKGFEMDLQKGKSNRDGLIQQIVTYVRDGHTVVRKQWVRSTFADHAKKNEEQKKKAMLDEKEKENKRETKKIDDANEKAHNSDVRAHKKHIKAVEESMGRKARAKNIVGDAHSDKHRKDLDKRKKADEERKKDEEKKNKNKKDKKSSKHTSFGHQDASRADSKAEQKMIQT